MRLASSVLLAILAASPVTHANCLPAKDFSSLGETAYLYLHTPDAAANTYDSIVGRFWQPGAFATTGSQACLEQEWLQASGSPAHTWYILGTLGAGECSTTGCPASEMIVSVEDRSTTGQQAYFTVGRVDETPLGSFDFDFSRTGSDWTLVPIPAPQVLSTTTGEVFQALLRFPDPASGFHGLPGSQAPGTITAFLLYRAGSTPTTRERSTWTFVERYPYAGGATQGTAVLVCPLTGAVRLAAALEFDHGEVLTHYVSSEVLVLCDTFADGAGSVDDGGVDGLFVKRETTGNLTVSWGPSCSSGDQGFELYQGTLGDWTSQVPVTCEGGSSWTFPAPASDAYFLAVPYEGAYEGSYGKRSDASERPRGPSPCRQRIVNLCPP